MSIAGVYKTYILNLNKKLIDHNHVKNFFTKEQKDVYNNTLSKFMLIKLINSVVINKIDIKCTELELSSLEELIKIGSVKNTELLYINMEKKSTCLSNIIDSIEINICCNMPCALPNYLESIGVKIPEELIKTYYKSS